MPVVHPSHGGNRIPPHRLIDSTGVNGRGEDKWSVRGHGGPLGRIWRKVRPAVDESRIEARAAASSRANAAGPSEPVEGTGAGDASVSRHLLAQVLAGVEAASVIADVACDTRS